MTEQWGSLTEERRQTHGDWARTARIALRLKAVLHEEIDDLVPPLRPEQREALDMILAKIARIVSGDPNHPDHWQDIAGYSQLGMVGAPKEEPQP